MGIEDDQVIAGLRHGWGGSEVPFGFRRRDRRQHLYCVGKTGTGKSTLIRNLILQDIEAGEGVGIIDPHGELVQEILEHIPPWRTDDVVFFDPADLEQPVGWNMIEDVPPEDRHLIASAVVGALKSIWRDSWGPRLEYILYASVAALLECENTTLLGVQRMLVDPQYRRWVVKQVKDPAVRSFWVDEFESWDRKLQVEAVSPIQNKVGQLLMSAPVRNVLGQVRRRVRRRVDAPSSRGGRSQGLALQQGTGRRAATL